MKFFTGTLTVLIFMAYSPYPGFAQQTINGLITHDSLQRTYILYVPANYTGNSPVPLVFNFHGFTSNANAQMRYGDFRSIADSAGFIVVHPQGTRILGLPHWNVGGPVLGSNVDDVGFTEALLDSISDTYNIDAKRVYATGMSNGGYMSYLLACQLSDRIAAIASVTGSMTQETFDGCTPQHPTPVLQIHGTSDGTVPYNGSNWSKSIPDVLQYWVSHNHCSATFSTTALPDINTSDGSTVEHIVYDGGDDGVTVEHYKVTGGGHDWPGSRGNMDISASVEIWKFFSRYDIDGVINTTGIQERVSLLPDAFELHQNFPNPFNPTTTIEYSLPMQKTVSLVLTDALGREITRIVEAEEKQAGTHSVAFRGTTLPSGVYMYRLEAEGIVLVRKMLLMK